MFWKLLKKAKKKEKLVKSHIMNTKSKDHKISLPAFVALVIEISKGKAANCLSTKKRARELQKAKVDKDLLLMEFVKYEQSEVLTAKEQAEDAKHNTMRDGIAAGGTEVANQMSSHPLVNIERQTIQYVRPSLDDDVVGWEISENAPDDDDEGNELGDGSEGWRYGNNNDNDDGDGSEEYNAAYHGGTSLVRQSR